MKIVWRVLGGILLFSVIGTGFASMGLKEIRSMVINEVDLQKIQDGTYVGSFKKARWTHEVEVEVKDHRIVAVYEIGKNFAGNQGVVDGAIDAIIQTQSVVIDVVSGATVNTKAFQKAVENALTEGTTK